MEVLKLKGKMAENNDTLKELAKALGVSPTTAQYKVNGKTEFTQDEIARIIERYHLTKEETFNIFFANVVS